MTRKAPSPNALRNFQKAFQDSDLLKALQSEIKCERSSNHFKTQNEETLSQGGFAMDWDSLQSQDIVLRKKNESGEEVSVSALLGHETPEDTATLPREALMKVCIKKSGLSCILQFDCGVSSKGENRSDFYIRHANYMQSSACLGPSVYRGPSFSSLDPHLQDELKRYLVSRGIEEKFTNFLLDHLHRKEQKQYVNWLDKLVATVSNTSER